MVPHRRSILVKSSKVDFLLQGSCKLGFLVLLFALHQLINLGLDLLILNLFKKQAGFINLVSGFQQVRLCRSESQAVGSKPRKFLSFSMEKGRKGSSRRVRLAVI